MHKNYVLPYCVQGHHQDKIIYKIVQSIINMSKNTDYFTIEYVKIKITDYSTIKYVNITDNSTVTFCQNNFQNFVL